MTTQGAGRPRIAVIGAGSIGTLHAQAIAASSTASLASVCDVDPVRGEALAKTLGVKSYQDAAVMLAAERPDGVTIATPDHLHRAVALTAIAQGCHVFCEKPLAESSEAARSMVEAAEERGVWLAVDYNRRFGFGYRTAGTLLERGTIGRLTLAVIHVSDRTPSATVARHPHVIFTTLLTHHIDLMRHFCGEIREVSATVPHDQDPALVRECVLSLRFAGGAVGAIVAGYRDGQSRTWERATFEGTQGRIVVDDVTRRVLVSGTDPDRFQTYQSDPFGSGGSFYETIAAHIRSFLDCLAAGTPPPVSGRDGLRGMEVAEAAVESHVRGIPTVLTMPEDLR